MSVCFIVVFFNNYNYQIIFVFLAIIKTATKAMKTLMTIEQVVTKLTLYVSFGLSVIVVVFFIAVCVVIWVVICVVLGVVVVLDEVVVVICVVVVVVVVIKAVVLVSMQSKNFMHILEFGLYL